jgi:hypothetical protein
MVSGRGVLVAVAVGYVVMSIFEKRQQWMLWVGILFANLSSASVLICLLILTLARINRGKKLLTNGQRIQHLIILCLLFVSLSLSIIDKVGGFAAGGAGYESHAFNSDSFFLQVISRSTLAVSFSEGQYLRLVAYGMISVALIMIFFSTFLIRKKSDARKILYCCVPGIFLEGLGVLAMTFPLIWVLSDFMMLKFRKTKFFNS